MFLKFVISVAFAFVVTQVICESTPLSPQVTTQHSAGAIAAARKIRLLNMNPGVIRLYRLLGASGVHPSLDDEDTSVPDDESYFQKRQYDDYGHMRFGKRNPKDFDDYGHMRFGK